jgi:hypothetical protein
MLFSYNHRHAPGATDVTAQDSAESSAACDLVGAAAAAASAPSRNTVVPVCVQTASDLSKRELNAYNLSRIVSMHDASRCARVWVAEYEYEKVGCAQAAMPCDTLHAARRDSPRQKRSVIGPVVGYGAAPPSGDRYAEKVAWIVVRGRDAVEWVLIQKGYQYVTEAGLPNVQGPLLIRRQELCAYWCDQVADESALDVRSNSASSNVAMGDNTTAESTAAPSSSLRYSSTPSSGFTELPLSSAAAARPIPSNDYAVGRTRCLMGMLCQRPDAEHSRLFSHPGDSDWVGPTLGGRFCARPMSDCVENMSARNGQCDGVLSGRLRLSAQPGPRASQARRLDRASQPIQSHRPRAASDTSRATRGRSRSSNPDSDFVPKRQAVHPTHSRRRPATDKRAAATTVEVTTDVDTGATEVLSSQEKQWRKSIGSPMVIPTCVDLTSSPSTSPESIDLTSSPSPSPGSAGSVSAAASWTRQRARILPCALHPGSSIHDRRGPETLY